MLSRAADAVAPSGILMIAGHARWPSWMTGDPPFDYHFPSNSEVIESLGLQMAQWHVALDEVVERPMTGPEGRTGSRDDNVLRVHRVE